MSDKKDFNPLDFAASVLTTLAPRLEKITQLSEELQAVKLENEKLKNQLLKKAVKSLGKSSEVDTRLAIIV